MHRGNYVRTNGTIPYIYNNVDNEIMQPGRSAWRNLIVLSHTRTAATLNGMAHCGEKPVCTDTQGTLCVGTDGLSFVYTRLIPCRKQSGKKVSAAPNNTNNKQFQL